MRKIYRISPALGSPELEVYAPDDVPASFTGTEMLAKKHRTEYFSGRVRGSFDWQDILHYGPGCFVVSEEAWDQCEDMYYCITQNDIELLSVATPGADLRIIVPRSLWPDPDDPSGGFDPGQLPTLFRMEGKGIEGKPTDLFCVAGTNVLVDEFKYSYESYGFRGLTFEEVWAES